LGCAAAGGGGGFSSSNLFVYKESAAVKSTRAYLTEVREGLQRKGHRFTPNVGDHTTFGAVLASNDQKVIAEFTPDEWEYLTEINKWCNYQLHVIKLSRPGEGMVEMICPSDHYDVDHLRTIARKVGIVTEEKQLIVNKSTGSSPDRTPLVLSVPAPTGGSPPRIPPASAQQNTHAKFDENGNRIL